MLNLLLRTYQLSIIFSLFVLFCCTSKDENNLSTIERYTLSEGNSLMIPLDSVSPPKSPFVQIIEGDNGADSLLTYYNPYNRSIYWYDLTKEEYLPRTVLVGEGENSILRPVGYYVNSRDSIFVFDMGKNELVLINAQGKKLDANTLINDHDVNDVKWALVYPQFFPKTVTPLIRVGDELVFSGSYMWAIPDDILDSFKFTASYHIKNKSVQYAHRYPQTKYGSKFNWDDPYYTTIYYDWNPNEKIMVYSFPISNTLYTGSFQEDMLTEKMDSGDGSRTIRPLSSKGAGREAMLAHLIESNLYAGLKYDKYRNVYYRVLMEGVQYTEDYHDLSVKPISIVIYDEEFKVIGKKKIGLSKNWNIDNIMVSREGLLIEYLESAPESEDFIVFIRFNLIEYES